MQPLDAYLCNDLTKATISEIMVKMSELFKVAPFLANPGSFKELFLILNAKDLSSIYSSTLTLLKQTAYLGFFSPINQFLPSTSLQPRQINCC